MGPFFLPKVGTTLTKRRLYCIRLLARPVFFFFFSCLATWEKGGMIKPGLPLPCLPSGSSPGREKANRARAKGFGLAVPQQSPNNTTNTLTYLRCLTSYFPGSGQGTMDFTCDRKGGQQAVRTRRPHPVEPFLPQLKFKGKMGPNRE